MSANIISYSVLIQKISSATADVQRDPGETENAWRLRRHLTANRFVREQKVMDANALARCITNVIILAVSYSREVNEVISQVLNKILSH